jgi:hypothetical protein
MKKIIIILFILTAYYMLLTTNSNAQTPTPNAEQIKDRLIENIASRVAELDLVEKRGIVGVVTDVTNTQITLSDNDGNTRFVDVDELTKFSNPDQEDSFGISDITVGDTLSAIGLYNKESRRLLARFVNVVTIPRFIHGEIGEIDTTNLIFDVVGKNGEIVSIDVGNSTRILSYTKDEDLTNMLFSEIEKNQRVIVAGFPDKDNENLIIADRIILFPEIPSTIRINKTSPSSTQSAS